MRVADERSVGGVFLARVQDGLESAGWAVKVINRSQMGGRRVGHSLEFIVLRICSNWPDIDLPCRILNHMSIDPIQLTKQLVDIESTTYHEGLAGAFLYEYLIGQRYSVERMEVSQPDHAHTPGAGKGERFNVYAALPGVTPDVVLSTHMYTVPPYFGCTEDDEFLYGRGTCDAKGIIAAQVAAADQLREAGVKVGLLFVVGEERDSAGAAVANGSPKGSRFLINGEPTDNRLALASKGALRVEIRAKGRMAHSAYPELGESAIDKLVSALNDVLAMPLPVEPEIGPSTLNIGLIEGGRAPNVIADKAEAHLLIRLVGRADEIKQQIVKTVGDRADVKFTLELPFVRMRKVGNLPTMVAKFTTDIPSLTAWGEPFLLGPGSIHVAHTPNEKIAKSELLEAVDLYVELAEELVRS
jgi:acetylornithine deacetylase